LIGVDTYGLLISFGTVLLATAFIFGNTIETILQSFILIFIIRPFDIGDKIFVKSIYDDSLTVQSINLTYIVCRASDGHVIIIPISKLISENICNLKRSSVVNIEISLEVPLSTPPAKLLQLKNYISQYLHQKSDIFNPDFSFHIDGYDDKTSKVTKMSIKLFVELIKCTWQDTDNWWTARTDLYAYLQGIVHSLDIEFLH